MNDIDLAEAPPARSWRQFTDRPDAWVVTHVPQLTWTARISVSRYARRMAGIWALVAVVWAVAGILADMLNVWGWLNWAILLVALFSFGRCLSWKAWRDGWLAR